MKVLKLALMISLSVLFLNSCTISNNNVNHAPIILSEPITIAYLDEEYNYNVNAIDEEGDNLVYELINSPEGMSIDINSGEIFWLPKAYQIGGHDVVISVDDGELPAIQSFTIVVQENDTINNDSVNIVLLELLPEVVVVFTGDPFTINIVVENVTNLLSGDITLTFDETKLAYRSSALGGFFSDGFKSALATGGSLNIAFATTDVVKPSGSGTILTVNFERIDSGVTNICFGVTVLTNQDGIDFAHTQGGCVSFN